MDKDLSVLDLNGHALERSANAWPPNTLSRCGLKDRAVVGTHQVAAIDSKNWLSTQSKEIPMCGHRFR